MEENYLIEVSPEEKQALHKPTPVQVCALYSIAVALLIYIGFRVQRKTLYPGLLITEFILILLPTLILLYIKKYDVKKVLRLNRPGGLNVVLVISLVIFSLPVVGILNALNLLLIKRLFGRVIISEAPIFEGPFGLLISILVVAGSAAICEEVMFRGVIQRGFERFGAARAILVSSFLFGLLHLDFHKLLGTFLLGALFGLMVYRTNSLYTGMIAHFTNNSVAVFLSYGLSKLQSVINDTGVKLEDGPTDIDTYFSNLLSAPIEEKITVLYFWLICIAITIGLIFALITNTRGKTEKIQREALRGQKFRKVGLLWLAPGGLLILIMYVAIGSELMGIENTLVDGLRFFIGFY